MLEITPQLCSKHVIRAWIQTDPSTHSTAALLSPCVPEAVLGHTQRQSLTWPHVTLVRWKQLLWELTHTRGKL